jgi:hypothetical protein
MMLLLSMRISAVHAHIGEDARHRDRMADIGLARQPALTLVSLGADQVCRVNFLDLRRLEIDFEFAAQLGNSGFVVAGADAAGDDFEQIGVVRPHNPD